MKIKKILNRMRRDFTAIFECEHCGFEEKRDGYDDAFFHRNVTNVARRRAMTTDLWRPNMMRGK